MSSPLEGQARAESGAPAGLPRLWVNSGDSHFREPPTLFRDYLPTDLARRMPRSVRDPDGSGETVYVDGQEIRRSLPKVVRDGEFQGKTLFEMNSQPPGAFDPTQRLADLDAEGVWAEVCYPSLGLWASYIKDPRLALAGARAINEWVRHDISPVSKRFVAAASLPLLEVPDAVAELERCASLDFRVAFLPTEPPVGDWNDPKWEPLWAAAEAANVVLGFHIGTDRNGSRKFGNPGGAILNYVETTFGGQRVVVHLIASGALERHPGLKVLVSEGGATWAPFLGDRMNEGYRQHQMMAWPKLTLSPKEYIYRQVYASFQHDVTAVPTVTAMGYQNVMFGTDYPHIEGTFGHTQQILAELFDGIDPAVRHRITVGAFRELFPEVGEPPSEKGVSR